MRRYSGGRDDSDSNSDPIGARWEKCFDAWDGNHGESERVVRNQFRAPSTFSHVETRYSTGKFPRSVVMTYEAEDLFGVPLRLTAVGESDLECNVLVISYE